MSGINLDMSIQRLRSSLRKNEDGQLFIKIDNLERMVALERVQMALDNQELTAKELTDRLGITCSF